MAAEEPQENLSKNAGPAVADPSTEASQVEREKRAAWLPDDAKIASRDYSVYEAIGWIIAEMKGVGKDQQNAEQGWRFRGIDDVMKAAHPLFGKYGVFPVPHVIERIYEEITYRSGSIGHVAHLHVEWTFYGPKGDSFTGSTWGEGADSGDKATNKAATAALKYLLFPTLAVADPEDDADRTTPEEHTSTGNTQQTRAERAGTSRPVPGRAPVTTDGATFLEVPKFDDNPRVKKAGARFDTGSKRWFVPAGKDLGPFSEWLPEGVGAVAGAFPGTTLVDDGPPPTEPQFDDGPF